MFDPDVKKLNDNISYVVNTSCSILISTIVTVGGVIGGVIATPFAIFISSIALPILYCQRYPISADLKWLKNRIHERHGETFSFGRLKDQDYRQEAPQYTEISIPYEFSKEIKYKGKFIFNNTQDLSWLWHKYHLVNTEKRLIEHNRKISSYWSLAIPVIGIYAFTLSIFARNSNSVPHDSEPKGTIESHFNALKWKLCEDKIIDVSQFNQAQLSYKIWNEIS